ncbi:hypothetical protein FG05_35160 [Fusarium graminearum]|nr:hypothetical protein FG05_35160 [Fusarium graminearum]
MTTALYDSGMRLGVIVGCKVATGLAATNVPDEMPNSTQNTMNPADWRIAIHAKSRTAHITVLVNTTGIAPNLGMK